MTIHVVKPGDSIYLIARSYGIPSEKIISDNELANPDQLVVGQTLVIMTDDFSHTVRPGESLYTIAKKYGVTVSRILAANPDIKDPAKIDTMLVLKIPLGGQKRGSILVNGYAFPNIDAEVLRKTLPYLTYLSVFSYQVTPQGGLTAINDTPLIEAARAAGVAPMMVITNLEEGAGFSSELAHEILSSEQVQDVLLENVLEILESKNYFGLDIDFEYIYPEDRENYNRFLRKTSNRLRPLGYTLTTAVAPKISGEQKGLLYEAHDYPAHGDIVDNVIIMTYEWGYTYAR